jgi:Fe-S-cluster containining protein
VIGAAARTGNLDCRACGACCAFSRTWPRFTTEDDVDLDRIPRELVDDGRSGMRCVGDRCAALAGEVGVATSCVIYPIRPHVCRACEQGDEACLIARRGIGV